jgi:hypothetical protein
MFTIALGASNGVEAARDERWWLVAIDILGVTPISVLLGRWLWRFANRNAKPS